MGLLLVLPSTDMSKQCSALKNNSLRGRLFDGQSPRQVKFLQQGCLQLFSYSGEVGDKQEDALGRQLSHLFRKQRSFSSRLTSLKTNRADCVLSTSSAVCNEVLRLVAVSVDYRDLGQTVFVSEVDPFNLIVF